MAWKRRSMVSSRPTFLLLSIFLFSIFHILAVPSPILAKVTGECVNCHTMHNSQGGSPMPGVGSISETGPFGALTRGTCVGCHSNTGSATIKTLGSSNIPVVFNTAAPVNELAGGNFYWVVNSGESYGHNVLTIPGIVQDTKLSEAPGIPTQAQNGGACDGCHSKIADCTSCHNPYHHGEDERPVVGVTQKGNALKAVYYRYLANGSSHHSAGGVSGIEDSDWERTKSSSDHNEYKGGVLTTSGGHDTDHSMSDYCGGCHQKFHDSSLVGTSSPWLKHPNNYALPADVNKEYRLYNTQDGTTKGLYNPQAPVARPDLTGYSGPSDQVTPSTDQVFCLSCHRPHGTPYKDILRWAYDPADGGQMIAGTSGPGARTGCFICHTSKDGV